MHRLLKIGTLILTLTMLTSTLAMFPATSSPETPGPFMDKLLRKVIRSQESQYSAITTRELDVMSPVTAPDIIQRALGETPPKIVTSRALTQKYRYTYNLGNDTHTPPPDKWVINRRIPINDVNFRHALNHLMPTAYILGTIFKFTYDKCESVVMAPYGEWHNPNVEKHPYSPTEAIRILGLAGYIYSAVKTNWVMPYDFDGDGTKGTTYAAGAWSITDLDDVVPTIDVMTTVATVSVQERDTGQAWVNEMNAIGLSSFRLLEMTSAEKLPRTKVWDYYIAWHINTYGSGGAGVANDVLFNRYHGSQATIPGSFNVHQIRFPAADAQMNIICSNPDHTAQVAACWAVQEMLCGGSATNPMPDPSQANNWLRGDNYWNWSIPEALVGSRVAYVISQPELRGLVNVMGSGVINSWSRFNAYWTTGTRPGTTEKYVIWLTRDFPEPLNPVTWTSDYASGFVGQCMEDLIRGNPYTNQYEPGLASEWGMELPTGLPEKVRYWYKIKSGLKWPDGYDFTAEDVKFTWDFIIKWQVAKWYTSRKFDKVAYTRIEGPLGTPNPNGDYAVIALTEVDLWRQGTYSGEVDYFPPQIYDRTWTKSSLEAYRPEFTPYRTENMAPGYPAGTMPAGATNLFGMGAFILTGLDINYAWAEYVANRGYWMSQEYCTQRLLYLFWRVGDTTKNGKVDISDLSKIAWAFYTWPGQPNWDPDADCTSFGFNPPEGKVDFVDLTVCGLYSGESRTVP